MTPSSQRRSLQESRGGSNCRSVLATVTQVGHHEAVAHVPLEQRSTARLAFGFVGTILLPVTLAVCLIGYCIVQFGDWIGSALDSIGHLLSHLPISRARHSCRSGATPACSVKIVRVPEKGLDRWAAENPGVRGPLLGAILGRPFGLIMAIACRTIGRWYSRRLSS